MKNTVKNILWWGRFDPDYSRNRILRSLLLECGYRLQDFIPRSSFLGTIEAAFTRFVIPAAVWVPAFRQRDYSAAKRFADHHSLPLIFDPLISAWDKVIFERRKFNESSSRSRRLLAWESSLFAGADLVIADTKPHASFFIDRLSAPLHRTCVVPVGAEESLFKLQHRKKSPADALPEILFYGSFINLQAPEVIVEAARQVVGAQWTLLGSGPLRQLCEQKSRDCEHIRYEEWLPYRELPERIGRADLLLGIFGSSAKAGRVIPNKVYQSLSCGRPLITRESPAYPRQLGNNMENGIAFIPPADPDALAASVRSLLARPKEMSSFGQRAHETYKNRFSHVHIKQALIQALALIGL